MKVDFFNPSCQTITTERRFGLYDQENQTPASIVLTDEAIWNATVVNNKGKTISFTAIDNCIDVLKENGEMDNRCDCMLTYEATLLLVELKNERGSWQTEGLAQVENIAKRMIEEIPKYYFSYKKRKAIVSNRKKKFPAFHNSNAEQRQYFSSMYKMRIQFDAEIIIE